MVGSIDPRCETVRGTHWPVKVAGVFGTRVAENHLGQRSKRPASTGRTYGCKRSDQTLKKTLAARGPSTYAQPVGGRSDRRDPAGSARPWPSVALAGRAAEAQAAQTRGRGTRQQDCPHRLEADDDGRELRRRADAWRIGTRRLRDWPVGGFRRTG